MQRRAYTNISKKSLVLALRGDLSNCASKKCFLSTEGQYIGLKKHKNFDTLIARLIVAGLMFCLLQIPNEPQLCNDTCLQLLNLYLGQ